MNLAAGAGWFVPVIFVRALEFSQKNRQTRLEMLGVWLPQIVGPFSKLQVILPQRL